MVLLIFVIHNPNVKENGRNFEVIMNRKTFFSTKQVEKREGKRNKD